MEQIGDVLVAGAGPSGNLAALGLAQRGFKVTVLDMEPSPPESPRATTYHPPVVKVLDRFGVLEDLRKVALYNDEFWMYFKPENRRVPLRTSCIKDLTNYPYALQCGQHTINSVLRKHLERLPNSSVRWNHEVVAIEQDGSGVTTTVKTPQGERRLRSDWVIGADGARSGVRRALGVPFEGHTWPERFVATNVWLDLEKYDFGRTTLVHDPENWAIAVKINAQGLWRVTFGESAELPEEAVRQRIPERYRQILPPAALAESYEIHSWAPYRVHQRCAEHLRVGRVLLAGDAAHITNPCGALGLTTGILDVSALVTVLSAVIEGRASETVLDFYDRDRRRVFWEVTNSAATEHKRRLREPDPERRALDFALIEAMQHNPGAARVMMLAFFDVEGWPMPV